jgi:hypothetical protein
LDGDDLDGIPCLSLFYGQGGTEPVEPLIKKNMCHMWNSEDVYVEYHDMVDDFIYGMDVVEYF